MVLQMPRDSYAPFALGLSLTVLFYGLLATTWWLAGTGFLLTLATVVAWLWPDSTPREIDRAGQRSLAWWAMVWVIVTEASLFAYFLFSYFYLGSMAQRAWPTGGPPDLRIAFPNTIILLVSSGTMYWAEVSAKDGEQTRLRIALLITFLLGAAFLVLQGFEYGGKSFALNSDAYSSLFFTITGFHGAHVAVGLLMNVFAQAMAWRGHFTRERHVALTNAALYWHFVDAVWVCVFTSLYLLAQ